LASSAPSGLEFRILGPVEVASNGERLALGGEKQRALLALLLLHENEVVSRDRIIDELWGERPPATVAAALNVYVSKLRKILGDAAAKEILVTQEPGYVLRVETGQLDSDRFASLSAEGKCALEGGSHDVAIAKLREALSLFRGRALDDLAHEDFARMAGARLEDARLATLMNRIEADLGQGDATGLVTELESLVLKHPLQERVWGQLMLALYRTGRQAEALETYQRARRTLDELGIEPSQDLKQLHSRMLRQDAALRTSRPVPTAEPSAMRPGLRRRPSRQVLVAAGIAVAVAATAAMLLTRDGKTRFAVPPPAADSVRVIDIATNQTVSSVPLGGAPGGLAIGDDAVWAANIGDGTLMRIDPATMKVVRVIGVPGISDVAAADGYLWATAKYNTVIRIPPDAPDLSKTIPIRRLPEGGDPAEQGRQIAVGRGSVWTLDGPAGIARIDPQSAQVSSRISLPGSAPDEIGFGEGFIWVADSTNRQLIQVNPVTERIVRKISLGSAPGSLAVGFGAVWVIDYSANVVWRVNPLLGRVERSIPIGKWPGTVAVSAGAVWALSSYDSIVTKIDPITNSVVRTIPVGYVPTKAVAYRNKLWITTR
jgi:DNA-binding SARP family transcriptional activator/streptogramin lyase